MLKIERIKRGSFFMRCQISCVFTYTGNARRLWFAHIIIFFFWLVVLLVLKLFHFYVLVAWWFCVFGIFLLDKRHNDNRFDGLDFWQFFFFHLFCFWWNMNKLGVQMERQHQRILIFTWISWSLMWKEPSKWSLKLLCTRK